MKKNILVWAVFVSFLYCVFLGYASEPPKNGYDWDAMPKAEKIAYCGILIYGMVGVGNPDYTSRQIKAVANYFAGRINFYYKENPLKMPIERAAAWAWPETSKLLK